MKLEDVRVEVLSLLRRPPPLVEESVEEQFTNTHKERVEGYELPTMDNPPPAAVDVQFSNVAFVMVTLGVELERKSER